MTNRFRVPRTLVHRLEELGVPVALALARANLPLALFEQERIHLTTEELFALYRAIGETSADPTIGLRLPAMDRMERYDAVAIAALCTRSMREAMERAARYKQLMCPERIEIADLGGETAVHFRWLLAPEAEPSTLVDLCFAWIYAIARHGAAQAVKPKRVEFARPPAHRAAYEEHFACPVEFRAERNALVFPAADMDIAFRTYNPELLAIVAPQLESELSQHTAEATMIEQVKGILKRLLAGQRPGVQDVARELRLSTRTLQRRLTEEGASFQHVMEEARRELARHYLRHSSLELHETAYLLGYEDANSFFRAFQNWEGTSPGQWRASQAVL